MPNPTQHSTFVLRSSWRLPAFALALLCALTIIALPSAQAQTFTALHTFTGGADGANPRGGGLLIDKAGGLYGGTESGGRHTSYCLENGCGVIFKMSPRGSGWAFSTLYSFGGGTDGFLPEQVLSFGPSGSLYGTTYFGPGDGLGGLGNGTVFNLKPPATACKTALCPWTETVLYRFLGSPADGAEPAGGHPVFDRDGNLYSTTFSGGPGGSTGNVYELERATGWTERVLYNFPAGSNGLSPWSGVVFDNTGNLYGTTLYGGGSGSAGVIFQLTPSGSGWIYQVLHAFEYATEGSSPYSAVVFDRDGNLYGTTSAAGPNGAGTVWELSHASGSWNLIVLHAFTGSYLDGPWGGLLIDSDGNLYGTAQHQGVYGWGSVFKLSRSGGSWNYTSLYDFTGESDGAQPGTQLVMDANSNLYGTTFFGGLYQGYSGFGVVFKISQP